MTVQECKQSVKDDPEPVAWEETPAEVTTEHPNTQGGAKLMQEILGQQEWYGSLVDLSLGCLL